MTDTPNLTLPCIEGSQAQKHVTHNDALRILDSLVQLAVLDRDLTAPPGSPSEGQRWIVKTGATGAWTAHDNAVAAWQDGAWMFSAPKTGWIAYVVDEGSLVVWNGTAWGDFFSAVTSIQNLASLGVGTTADSTNPLSAKLNNALFLARSVAEGGDGSLRYKLSKESAAKTLSFLFQDNFSGRAEIGLTSDDDFHFKVSPDGSSWNEGIRIDRSSGKVSFPVTGGPREMLAADRTYYVRTDGNDANNGLTNTSGGAFLTIQKAIDTVAALDLSIYTATIQVGSGTYGGAVTLKPCLGTLAPLLKGDTTTPANVTISTAGADCLTISQRADWRIQGFKLATSSGGNCVTANGPGKLLIDGNMEFGACASNHMAIGRGMYVQVTSGYRISGSAAGSHLNVVTTAVVIIENGLTVTLTGTPAWGAAFASVAGGAVLRAAGTTWSGAATGPRYTVTNNAVLETGGAGTAYLPGNAAHSTPTANGGQYV